MADAKNLQIQGAFGSSNPTTTGTQAAPAAKPVFDYSGLASNIPMMGLRSITTVNNWLNMLIYGPYGHGKTHLAGTAALVPEMCDILYISLEGGEKTLRVIADMCRKHNIDPSCIQVMPIQTYKQYAQIYETLVQHIAARDSNNVVRLRVIEFQLRGIEFLQATGWMPSEKAQSEGAASVIKEMQARILEMSKDAKLLEELIPNPKRFRTVITDSLTEAQKYCMYQLLGIDPLRQKLDAEPDSAEWKDWGASREMIQFLVRRYRDLPIHTLWICGEDETEDAKKRKYYTPLLPGKLSKDVQGLVDVVGYLRKCPQEGGGIKHRIYLEGGDYGPINIAAKHRFGPKLKGCFLDEATMQTIYDLDNK